MAWIDAGTAFTVSRRVGRECEGQPIARSEGRSEGLDLGRLEQRRPFGRRTPRQDEERTAPGTWPEEVEAALGMVGGERPDRPVVGIDMPTLFAWIERGPRNAFGIGKRSKCRDFLIAPGPDAARIERHVSRFRAPVEPGLRGPRNRGGGRGARSPHAAPGPARRLLSVPDALSRPPTGGASSCFSHLPQKRSPRWPYPKGRMLPRLSKSTSRGVRVCSLRDSPDRTSPSRALKPSRA